MLRYDPCLCSVDISGRCDKDAGVRHARPRAVQACCAMLVAALALIVSGCGHSDRPGLGKVHGRVTLDGQPVVRATVAFQSESGGREASGLTDDNGEYVLKYLRDELGAVVGQSSVRITKQRTPDPNTETVPQKYNRMSTLTADVKSGSNEINFDLTSQ